jgi:hypothetical protein
MPDRLLTIASPEMEAFFAGRAPRCLQLQCAGSLGELRQVLDGCLAAAAAPTTLDLVGHSTRGHRLLRLGNTPIDMLDASVARFFHALAADRLLPRLSIVAVRLLGCETAVTDAGQRTIRMLAQTLRVPVYGTLQPLMKSHSGANGFHPAFTHLLVEAGSLEV